MATRRQREDAAPRPAANAAISDANAVRGSTSHSRSSFVGLQRSAAARSGPTPAAAAAARSGPRNQTASSSSAAAARSGSRNQTATAAIVRPNARSRRAQSDIGNHVNSSVVDREANRRRLTRSLNATTADVNTIAPGSFSSCRSGGVGGASRAGLGGNKKLSKGATTRVVVTRTRAKMDGATADSLKERVAAAEATAARAVEEVGRAMEQVARVVEELVRTDLLFQVLNDRYDKFAGDYPRHKLFITEATQAVDKLSAMVDKKESELQKVMESNVRLLCVVDQKEAQLQAMSEQCKALALNSN